MDATAGLPVFEIVMGLLGGLALFLFGMGQMTDSLKLVAGDSMRRLLGGLTRNRVMGTVTGAVVTAVIQSSSVTTVLVVGFVSAGVMSLQQSVAVILGANVGTTITAQIVAFKVTEYALLLVALGFALLFGVRREWGRLYGAMIMGLGLIFFGMGLMSDATEPLRSYGPFIETMKRMGDPSLGILSGAVFTALVQSSSATTGLVIVLAAQGFITLEAGIALVLGSNIGTCVTALLAALGRGRPGQQAALVHLVFNVVGVAVWFPLIGVLAQVVGDLSPARPDLEGAARLAAETPRQIANAHTAFNLANTLVFLGFTGPIAALVLRFLPARPAVVPERARPRFLDDIFLETPALAADRIRLEIVRFGRFIDDVLVRVRPALLGERRSEIQAIVDEEDEAEQLYEAILGYVRRLSGQVVDARVLRHLSALTNAASDIQHVGETLATNLVDIGRQRHEGRHVVSAGTRVAFQPLGERVRDAYRMALDALEAPDPEIARRVVAMKPEIQEIAASIRNHLGSRLLSDDPDRLALFRLENATVEVMLRIYYFAKRIAKEVLHEHEAVSQEAPLPDVAATGDGTRAAEVE